VAAKRVMIWSLLSLLALSMAAMLNRAAEDGGPAEAVGDRAPTGSFYVEQLPGVRTGPANAAERRTNARLINARLGAGAIMRMHPGTRLEIAETLIIGSGGGIVGDPGTRPVIYMPADAFTNRNDVADEGRYGLNAVGIRFSGELSGSLQPSKSVRIENLSLVSERRSGRRLRGIVGQNVTGCTIRNVEISGFPMGIGVALASARGCRLSGIHVHDFYDSTAWKLLPQSTGIEIDNDLIAGVPSSDVRIERFDIRRIEVGGALLAKWGYQTDGINVMNSNSRVAIADGSIADIGEGIDIFGSESTVDNVRIDDAHIFGLKFVHGASRNRVRNLTVTNAGLAGVNFSGSDVASQDTAGNVVEDLIVRNVDSLGEWKDNASAGILVSGRNARRVPVGNRVLRATIDLGPNGKYGWVDQSTGHDNVGTQVEIRSGARTERPILILYGGGRVGLRSRP